MKHGIRDKFINWLHSAKKMTYTKYSKLGVVEKRAIQKEYNGR